MANAYLILRLEGPLQAWGMRGRWDYRDSGTEPTKSGIIGLLGCAMGYPVNDPHLEELDQQIEMGVRVDQEGVKLTDYQTINAYPEEASKWRSADGSPKGEGIVSRREYLQGASFLVVLKGNEDVIERCAAAVQMPVWPYYLGRKGCIPTRPVFEAISTDYLSIENVLQSYPWEGDSTGKSAHIELRYVVDDAAGAYMRNDRIRCSVARTYSARSVTIGKVAVGLKEVLSCI